MAVTILNRRPVAAPTRESLTAGARRTQLAPAEETSYRQWMQDIGHTRDRGFAVDDEGTGTDYDYRGFFRDNGPVPIGEDDHFPDTYKLPTHPTFSNESRYATGDASSFAGQWDGDTFVPAGSRRASTAQLRVVRRRPVGGTKTEGFASQLFAGFDEYRANRATARALGAIGDSETVEWLRGGGLAQRSMDVLRGQIRLERAKGNPEEAARLEARLSSAEAALQDPTRLARFDAAKTELANTLQSAIERRAELTARAATVSLSDVSQRTAEAESFGEGFGSFADDPIRVVAELGLRSAPNMIDIVPAGIGGGLIGGPFGAAAGMFAGSAGVEYRASVVQGLQEAGVDLNSGEALLQAAADKQLMEGIYRKAAIRAGIIGTVDAATGMVAGRVLSPFERPLMREATNLVAQTGVQAAGGAAGEAGAQLATEGEIRPGEVLVEGLAEAVTAPADIATAAAAGLRDTVAERATARAERLKVLARRPVEPTEPPPGAPPGRQPSDAERAEDVIGDEVSPPVNTGLKPGENVDPRLADKEVRGLLGAMAGELVPGGGVAYTRDEHDLITGRTPSQNPEWFQDMRAAGNGMTVKGLRGAVDKALAGETLTEREQRAVNSMLEHIDAQRAELPGDRRSLERPGEAERRQDETQRLRVDEMSAPEMRAALLMDAGTGLPNRRAYEEREGHKPVTAAIDSDGLGWINTTMGHEAGDDLIRAIGDAISNNVPTSQTARAFHLSGDEFIVEADTEQDANDMLEAVRERLAQQQLEVTLADGTTITLDGIDISYGLGSDFTNADRQLAESKAARERQGVRAGKGKQPPSATISGRGRRPYEAEGRPVQVQAESADFLADETRPAAAAPSRPVPARGEAYERFRTWIAEQTPQKLYDAITSTMWDMVQTDERISEEDGDQLVEQWLSRSAPGKKVDDARQRQRPAAAAKPADTVQAPGRAAAGAAAVSAPAVAADAVPEGERAAVRDEPEEEAGTDDLTDVIEEHGVKFENLTQAERLYDSHTIYAFNEMDEQPSEVTSLEMLRSYTPDRLVGVPRAALERVAFPPEQRARAERLLAESETLANAPPKGYEVDNAQAVTDRKERELNGGRYSAVARRVSPWSSEKGYGDTAEAAQRKALEMVGAFDKPKPTVSANKVFTEDAAAKARALLRSKLSTASAGIDPEVMQAGITLAGYHIEKGARTFAAYSSAMIEDLGDVIRPYLKSWYMAVRYDPRAAAFSSDMDSAAAVDKADVNAPDRQAVIDEAANEAATSPQNDRPQPSQAQKQANGEGNYKLGEPVKLHGVTWKVENPKGSYRTNLPTNELEPLVGEYRRGRKALVEYKRGNIPEAFDLLKGLAADIKGNKEVAGKLQAIMARSWFNAMPAHYARGDVQGADGDKLDAFLGPRSADESLPVFVVDTNKLSDGKTFDEHKVMIGFRDEASALGAFMGSYNESVGGRIFAGIKKFDPDEFATWAQSESKKPVAGKSDDVAIRTIRIGLRDRTISESTSLEPREKKPVTPQLPAPAGSTALGAPLRPEGSKMDPRPSAPVGDRWTADPGVIPGEPQQYLDGDNADDAAAVLIEHPIDGSENSVWEAVLADGTSLGRWDTEQEAGRAAEAAVDNEATEVVRLARMFAEKFAAGAEFPSIIQARRDAGELLGRPVKPGTTDVKLVDEAIELGAVMRGREIAKSSGVKLNVYDKLVALYRQMPTLGSRTSTSVMEQAYSTPLPLAYIAANAAGLNTEKSVYDPAAGNGALLITAYPSNIHANELNAERAANLKETLGKAAKVTENDGAAIRPKVGSFDVVIANPPFGVVKDEAGRTRRYKVDHEYETGEIDHAIAMKSLEAMKHDGSAVLIVGSVAKTKNSEEARSDAYNSKAKREFYLKLYGQYNVVDHFTVDGDLYSKQGAGWPIDVIVIRGRGKSAMPVPAVKPPRVYDTWHSLGEVLNAKYESSSGGVREPLRATDSLEQRPESGDGRAGGRSGEQRPDRQLEQPAPQRPADVRVGPVVGEPGGARPIEPVTRKPAEAERIDDAERRPRRVAVGTAEGSTAKQVPYKPASTVPGMGTLVPVNMQTATEEALDSLKRRVGSIDEFVADRLGYKVSELGEYFGAEQVDSLALGLDNLERGAGFIIGDQTGIGKGRVVAAVLRYAIRAKRTPIFITEKPNLYGDMYRDLTDIGIQKMLGREPEILMTNAAQTVPLDEDGRRVLKSGDAGEHNALLNAIADEGTLGGKYDMVFTTYSQMQTLKGESTPRMRFLETMGRGGIVIFDESHNAGGSVKQKEGAKPIINRSTFARQLAQAAHGVFYSSATYAKRPDVMDLYASTDMRLAVSDISNLAEAIQKGGVPMQQVVASMLAGAGQYVRRERSFDGIVYNAPVINVSRKTYADYSNALASIQKFSEAYVPPATKRIDKEMKAEGKSISPDGSTGGAGAISTNFTSIMHNLIDQMLLSITADAAAERAIKALKDGEKPVITVANTMGAFIEDYVDGFNIHPGDKLAIDFNSLLTRYLERTRWISIRKPFTKGPGLKHYLSDDEIGPAGVDVYENTKEAIRKMDFALLPVSPIDHIRQRLLEAGYKVGEITGRQHTLDYRPGGPFYRVRSTRETSIRGRRETISGFNRGDLDAMVINQAGSTGLSLHASEKFKDQRKRRMILAQAEKNIDTHMQMLGRVNRTGQVVLPEYDQLVADVPAVKRPAAVLSKKMASLNANTTAARGHALKAENVPDFINEYGDLIAARLMSDDHEMHERLGEPLGEPDGDGYDTQDAARKVTGRIPLLPIEDQERLYEQLETEYDDLLRQKEAAGESVLEAKTLNLDAQVKNRKQVVAPQGINSPFADGVYVEEVSAKRLGKPHTATEVLDMVATELKIDRASISVDNMEEATIAGNMASYETVIAVEERVHAYRREIVDDMASPESRANTEARIDGQLSRFRDLMTVAHVGQSVRLQTNAGNYFGVVVKIEQKGEPKNPLALSTWKVTIAMADSSRMQTLPMSQLEAAQTVGDLSMTRTAIMPEKNILGDITVIRAFDELQTEAREDRTIVTGNLLAGFDHVGRGTIINFTDAEGGVRQGILMPKGYNYDKAREDLPVALRSADQVLQFVRTGHDAKSTDRYVVIKQNGDGLRIEVPEAKKTGGRYFLNPAVLSAIGGDFVSVGGRMRADVSSVQANTVIEALKRAGASFEADENLKVAAEIAGTSAKVADSTVDEDVELLVGSAAEKGKGIGVKAAKRFVDRLVARWKNVPARVIVTTRTEMAGMPENLKAALDKRDPRRTSRGMHIQSLNAVWIFADNIPSKRRLAITVIHEILGHYASYLYFGESYQTIREFMLQTFPEMAARLERGYRQDMRTTKGRNIVGNELIAWIATEMEMGTASQRMRNAFERFVLWLNRNLQAVFGRSIDLTVLEARDLIRQASRYARTGVGAPMRSAMRHADAAVNLDNGKVISFQEGKNRAIERRIQEAEENARRYSAQADAMLAEARAATPVHPDVALVTDAANDVEMDLMLAEEASTRSRNFFNAIGRVAKGALDGTDTVLRKTGKGQPLDRLFRVPFALFGSIDAQGVFHLSPKYKTFANRAVLSARDMMASRRFRWLRHTAGMAHASLIKQYGIDDKFTQALETAKRGLIDRYGLDKAYIERDIKRSNDERGLLMQGRDVLTQLVDEGVGKPEAEVLYRMLTGGEVSDADMAGLAVPIRAAIDGMGAEAVELGMLSAESYERNRGAYLHRSYKAHEANRTSLAKWASDLLASRRRKIIGNQFKGRGIFLRKPMDRILRDVPEDWFGRSKKKDRADAELLGRKFRVFDRLSAPGEGTVDLSDIAPKAVKERVLERIYWPADLSVPAKFRALESRGIFEVRDVVGGQLVLWRDFTPEERERMGEIVDARYAIAKTYQQMAHDLSTGRFFKDIAENPDWASTTDPVGDSPSAEDTRLKMYADSPWVKVPETKIEKSNTYRYGALAGMYVRSEIWRDLVEIGRMQKAGFWREVMKQWKLNKTARNPVVHFNNIMSNILLMDMADVRLQDFVRGLRSFVEKDDVYKGALEHGAFGSDIISQEIRDSVLKPILAEIEGQNLAESRTGIWGVMTYVLTKIKNADQKMIDTYRLEDELFRMATYIRKVSLGLTPEQAAAAAREQFLNYDIRAPWINALRETVLPFVAYTYRAVPIVAKSLADRPWKLAKYFTVAYLLNMLGYAIGGDLDDEDEERATLRPEEQGRTWIGVYRMIRTPFNDQWGNPIFLDVRRFIPAGDVFDMNQGSSALAIPAPFQFGGPMMIAAELMLNRQGFTGDEITNELTDTAGEKAAKVASFLWKSAAPSAPWIPGSWYADKIMAAATGELDPRMRESSVPLALANSFGLKLKPHDVMLNRQYAMMRLDAVDRALNTQLNALARDYARRRIDLEFYRTEVARINEKRLRVAAERGKLAPQ